MTGGSPDYAKKIPTDEMSDHELVRLAQRGHEASFHELVTRHQKVLFGLAFSLTGNLTDAEDLLQDTLLAAFEGLRRFEGRSTVKTWLSRILMNKSAKRHQYNSVREIVKIGPAAEAILQGTPVPSSHCADEVRLDVAAMLQRLSADHRAVLVLREIQGLSYDEIAKVLEVPVGTVESRLFRARQELRERLRSYLPG